MTEAVVNGNTYSDGVSSGSTRGLASGGHRTNFMLLVADLMVEVAAIQGTGVVSTSAVAIGTGSKSFTTTPSTTAFAAGTLLKAYSFADPTKYMIGTVDSHDAGALTMTVAAGYTGGSGTPADWVIVPVTAGGTIVDAPSTFALSGDISPAEITADQNNYSPTGLSTASTLRLSSDAARNITGLAGGADGRLLIVHNAGANNIVLKDESGSSTAANRFALSGDLTLGADQAALLQYDSTSSRWRLIASSAAAASGTLPRAHLSGLGLASAADTDHDITVAAGAARDSTDAADMALASALTKQIDAAWAVGTNAGGLDGSESVAGTPDANTWYHLWLIKRSDTGVVDALFSESATAPTMPASYDYKRRLGAVKTDGSANIVAFVQYGDTFFWKDPPLDIDTSSPGTSAVTRTLTVPTGVRVEALMNVAGMGDASANAGAVYISPLDVNDEAPSTSAAPLSSVSDNTSVNGRDTGQVRCVTNTSGQIRSRNLYGSATLRIVTLGWIDRRGRDD